MTFAAVQALLFNASTITPTLALDDIPGFAVVTHHPSMHDNTHMTTLTYPQFRHLHVRHQPCVPLDTKLPSTTSLNKFSVHAIVSLMMMDYANDNDVDDVDEVNVGFNERLW